MSNLIRKSMMGLVILASNFVMGNEEFLSHPKVLATANSIDLDIRNNADYNGPFYIGSSYKENHLIYDTMADQTIIVNDGAKGSQFPGNYDKNQSESAIPVYFDANKSLIESDHINLGSVLFNGQKYKEKVCLKQARNERTDDTGTYCVNDFPFVAADTVIGDFEANGVLGLAPSNSKDSIIYQLKSNGQIKNAIVGLNFENPLDTD